MPLIASHLHLPAHLRAICTGTLATGCVREWIFMRLPMLAFACRPAYHLPGVSPSLGSLDGPGLHDPLRLPPHVWQQVRSLLAPCTHKMVIVKFSPSDPALELVEGEYDLLSLACLVNHNKMQA